jgi:hypothetical protein
MLRKRFRRNLTLACYQQAESGKSVVISGK